jgi:hypothetical protein
MKVFCNDLTCIHSVEEFPKKHLGKPDIYVCSKDNIEIGDGCGLCICNDWKGYEQAQENPS